MLASVRLFIENVTGYRDTGMCVCIGLSHLICCFFVVEEGSKQNRQGKTGERTSSTSGFSSNRGKTQKRFQDRGKQNAEEQEEGEGRQTTTGRGRGVRRGGRGGMGRTGMAGRGGKREFDRRSGSDKTYVCIDGAHTAT